MDQNPARGDGDRRSHWRGLLNDWAASGLSQAEFCRRRGVSANAFSGWKGRLGRAESQTALAPPDVSGRRTRPAFVEILTGDGGHAQRATHGFYELLLRSGRLLRLASDFDPQRVRELIAIAEASDTPASAASRSDARRTAAYGVPREASC